MTEPVVIASYNTTAEAADGLALATLLGEVTGAEVMIAKVMERDRVVASREQQRQVSAAVQELRGAVVAAQPSAAELDIIPVLDASLERGLRGAAQYELAGFIVLGSTHHSRLGRLVLGMSAESVSAAAPCPVAVAPPEFRHRPALDPLVIGVAYDGSASAQVALERAHRLAGQAGATLRVVAVRPPVHRRPMAGPWHPERALEEAVSGLDGRVEHEVLRGEPGAALCDETDGRVGMLFMGTRAHGTLRRAVEGSVSTRVLRHARAPVVVCPAR